MTSPVSLFSITTISTWSGVGTAAVAADALGAAANIVATVSVVRPVARQTGIAGMAGSLANPCRTPVSARARGHPDGSDPVAVAVALHANRLIRCVAHHWR